MKYLEDKTIFLQILTFRLKTDILDVFNNRAENIISNITLFNELLSKLSDHVLISVAIEI